MKATAETWVTTGAGAPRHRICAGRASHELVLTGTDADVESTDDPSGGARHGGQPRPRGFTRRSRSPIAVSRGGLDGRDRRRRNAPSGRRDRPAGHSGCRAHPMLADPVRSGWPAGMGVLVRRERPHPGARLLVFEAHGDWRYQALATDTMTGAAGPRHRAHARVKDKIRNIKQPWIGRFRTVGFRSTRPGCSWPWRCRPERLDTDHPADR
jgi:hypothetical protein